SINLPTLKCIKFKQILSKIEIFLHYSTLTYKRVAFYIRKKEIATSVVYPFYNRITKRKNLKEYARYFNVSYLFLPYFSLIVFLVLSLYVYEISNSTAH